MKTVKVIPELPSDEISANTEARHTHSNKTVLDSLTSSVINNSHSHDNKSSLDKVTDALFTATYKAMGNGLTAGSVYSSGGIVCQKIGKVVIVTFNGVAFNTVSSGSTTANIIATGCPKPISVAGTIAMLSSTYDDADAKRVAVTTAGNLVLYSDTVSDSRSRNGQVVYLSND